LVLSQANGGSPAPLGEAQEGRRLLLREPPASGARRSVPLVADGLLLLLQAAGLRENLRVVGEGLSDLAQGELVPLLRLAGLHGRLLLASVLEKALKAKDAPRNLGPLRRVDGQLHAGALRSKEKESGSDPVKGK
jgi:hypothetical protein